MPRVQTYGPQRVRQAPLSATPRQNVATPESFGAGLLDGPATVAFKFLEDSQRRIAQIAVRDADQQMGVFELERRSNTENGWETRRGVDAAGLPDTVGEEFKREAGRIRLTLRGQRQLDAFDAAAATRIEGATRWASQYAGSQLRGHDEERHAKFMETAVANGVANLDDLPRLALERDRIIAESRDFGSRYGRGPEIINAEISKGLTALHGGVITRLLTADRDQDAQAYFEATKDQISGTALPAIERDLHSASSEATGLRTADALWQQFGPTSDGDPIALDRMEDAARQQFGDNPKVYDATMKYLRERKASVDASRQDRSEQLAGTLWGAVAQGATLSSLRRTPEYWAAPGKLQSQLTDEVVSQAEHRANRAYTMSQRAALEGARAENEKERAGWASYWRYSSPEVLSQMNEAQIVALSGEIGIDHVNRLLTSFRAVTGPDALRAATIDNDLFKDLAQGAQLNPYSPNDSQKVELGRLKARVEDQIAVEQQRRGNKPLTREEQEAVMTSVLDKHVMIDRWGRDEDKIAAVVSDGDQAAAYVPIANVPPNHREELANYIRSKVAHAATMSTADVMRVFGSRIERAYAAQLMRLGNQAVIDRLEGK